MNKLILLVTTLAVSLTSQASVVLVGNSAMADTLSNGQAKALFLGKKKNLPNGDKVVLLERPKGDVLREEFHQKVTGKSEAQLQSYWSRLVFTGKAKPPKELSSSALIKAAVANKKGHIGYIDESDVDASVKVLLKP